ncbi:MAG: UDP-N-acetylmuramate dehydrogenase [Actinomycetota bacterium]
MSLDALAAELAHALEGRVEMDRALARLTTYRLGGPARVYVEPAHARDVEALARLLRERDVEVLPLGRGSNLVVSDRGWPGVVVHFGAAFSWIKQHRDAEASLEAGAATPLPTVANWAARRGLGGVEFFVAIPGSIGGAVRMNAGAHGGEVADALHSITLVDLDAGDVEVRRASSLGLEYRRSNLGGRVVVLNASFALAPADPGALRARMEELRRHRAATQPGAVQNAGSVFKNPPGDSAGRLVEAAGLKGTRVGGAEVSRLHANFFLAPPGATAQDVYDLVRTVRARVLDAFGVELEPEIRFVGSFDEHSETHAGAFG